MDLIRAAIATSRSIGSTDAVIHEAKTLAFIVKERAAYLRLFRSGYFARALGSDGFCGFPVLECILGQNALQRLFYLLAGGLALHPVISIGELTTHQRFRAKDVFRVRAVVLVHCMKACAALPPGVGDRPSSWLLDQALPADSAPGRRRRGKIMSVITCVPLDCMNALVGRRTARENQLSG